ncbi:MAG: PIN domain-containing protein [Candidatus Nanoarchaeia archaeon]
MVCLDTSFLVDFLKGKVNFSELTDELERGGVAFIPAPALMELWLGALLSKVPEEEKERIRTTLAYFPILPLDEETAKESAEIEAELLKKGQIIQTEDIMIAGIARKNNESLLTRDSDFTRISGLKVLTY